MDMSNYPSNWKEISQRIRDRAGNKCEWCGIPNYTIVHRDRGNPFLWIDHDEWTKLSELDRLQWGNESKIVLTVSHYNHDVTDNSDGNLNCLCNRCHLNHDAKFHAANAKRTRARKNAEAKRRAGQMELF